MPCAPTWYRVGTAVLVGSVLTAADLTLSIGAHANVDGPVLATWQSVERPDGAGIPIMTSAVRDGGRYEALVQLPEPRVGRYVFRVHLTHEQAPDVVETVTVQVVPKSSPAKDTGESGGGGCGGGGGSGLALVMLMWALFRGGRRA